MSFERELKVLVSRNFTQFSKYKFSQTFFKNFKTLFLCVQRKGEGQIMKMTQCFNVGYGESYEIFLFKTDANVIISLGVA